MSITMLLAGLLLSTSEPLTVQTGTDINTNFQRPTEANDYIVREAMIPMRDGVRLHTLLIIPKSAHDLPIVLERTPYGADLRASGGSISSHMLDFVSDSFDAFVEDGYIIVTQDMRGRGSSEGDYVVTRPPRGPLNSTTTDDSTDAYDTIDWLVKNVPQSNGRVGMVGSSYDGWAVAMALLDPHPALKVAAPESPMIDGWMGDDWFHYGAYRQFSSDFIALMLASKRMGSRMLRSGYDDYEGMLRQGSAGATAEAAGLPQLPFWNRIVAHPAYDAFWQDQALDKLLARKPSSVPTMWEQGLWDHEDIYGALTSWEALKAAGHSDTNYLIMGPWRHSQANHDGSSLGPFRWKGDTASEFRHDVLLPFFDLYLKDRSPVKPVSKVLVYNDAYNRWDRFADWPGTGELTPLYLESDRALGFVKPTTSGEDAYVSDPNRPVPHLEVPVSLSDSERFGNWLVSDQRFAASRPDVLVYRTDVLKEPVIVQGSPVVDLFVKTSGTDLDLVVKLIDVYPDEVSRDPKMGGYQLPMAIDIFRGRYRKSFANPEPITPGKVDEYKFRLPALNHVFLPGHRIMVQVQSQLFPLYDRNPQTYVSNIFFAKPAAYRKADVSLIRSGETASAILLPIVPESKALQ